MKLFIVLLFATSIVSAQSPGSVGSLFKGPPLTASTQGKAGGTVKSLSAACQKMSSIQSVSRIIIPNLIAATSPILPFVGFALGASEYESPLLKLCDVLIAIDTNSTEFIIKGVAGYGNELTGNKFDTEMDAVDKTFNVANSIYDFNDGSMRKGSLTSAQTHQRFVELANSGVKVYNTRINQSGGGKGLETKADRQAQMSEVAKLSYQRSIISEATSCPSPKGNPSTLDSHSKYVLPRQEIVKEEESNSTYYYEMLIKIGTDMNDEPAELKKYLTGLNNLMHSGFKYNVSTGTFEEKNSVLIPGETDSNNMPKRKEVSIKKKVNLHKPNLDQAAFLEWKDPNSKKWRSFIKGQIMSTSAFGVLDGKKGRLEAKYRDYSFECSEKQLSTSVGVPRSDPSYYNRLRDEREKCQANLKVRGSDYENIYELYVDKLIISLKNKKTAETDIWNFEALNLGYNRDVRGVADKSSPTDYQKTEVACSDSLTPAELSKLSLKSNEVNLSLKETWAKEELKESIEQQNQMKAEYDGMKDISKTGKAAADDVKNKPVSPNPGVVIESSVF